MFPFFFTIVQDFSTWFTSFKYEKDEDLWGGLALCVEILLPSAEILCFRDFFFLSCRAAAMPTVMIDSKPRKKQKWKQTQPKNLFSTLKMRYFFHAPSVSWNIYVPDPIAQWVKNQIKMSQIRIFFFFGENVDFFSEFSTDVK